MFEALDLQTTDGEIAVINLESARRRLWNRFFADPLREGVAETVVEQEQLTAEFVGDVQALDRLEALVGQLVQVEAGSARAALIQAQVASMMHRFADARHFLARADIGGALSADVNRVLLNVDQACGANWARCWMSDAKPHENSVAQKIWSRWVRCWRIYANSPTPIGFMGRR